MCCVWVVCVRVLFVCLGGVVCVYAMVSMRGLCVVWFLCGVCVLYSDFVLCVYCGVCMFVWCFVVCVRCVCACGVCWGGMCVIMVWCVCLGCVCEVCIYGVVCVWNGV